MIGFTDSVKGCICIKNIGYLKRGDILYYKNNPNMKKILVYRNMFDLRVMSMNISEFEEYFEKIDITFKGEKCDTIKHYKGWELLKALSENTISYKNIIKDTITNEEYYINDNGTILDNNTMDVIRFNRLLHGDFTVHEEVEPKTYITLNEAIQSNKLIKHKEWDMSFTTVQNVMHILSKYSNDELISLWNDKVWEIQE